MSSTVQQGPMTAQPRRRNTRGHFVPTDVIDVETAPAPVKAVSVAKPATKKTWVFYHGASARFRWLLPEGLRARTQMGYAEFRPDGFSRDGNRIERGKYVTDDPEIAKALREAIAEKRLRGVWEDDGHIKLRCEYCSFLAPNNEQGRRELQAHVQIEHDRL